MSEALADDVVAFCRLFAALERDAVCFGRVTVAQCVVLTALREGEWDVSSLATHARVTNGAATRLVDGLEARDLVRRARDPEDRRRVMVELTEAGREEAERLFALTEAAVARILERIAPSRRRSVVAAVRLLRRAVEEVRDELNCC